MKKFIKRFSKILNGIPLTKKRKWKAIGKNCVIKKGTFNRCENVVLGDNIYVGPNAHWDALGGIVIEDNVIIGPKSVIYTYNHNYNSEKYLPYDEKNILKKVYIEKNVWIGFGVIISPGIHIGEGSIIAIGSVVTKDVPPLTIVGGNPAREIKKRDEQKYTNLKTQDSSYLKAKQKKSLRSTIDKI